MGKEIMGKEILFPFEAKFSRVMGIIQLLLNNDGKLSMHRLTRMSGEHVDDLLPQVDAAKMLGFIKVREDDVYLLDFGKKFYEEDKSAVEKVRSVLLKSEPFATAYALSKSLGNFTVDQLAEELNSKGIPLYGSDEEEAKKKINDLLLQWAIRFNILDYDGEKKVWLSEKPVSDFHFSPA